MDKIAQGAEAVIYQDGDTIFKDRIIKKYRHKIIDEKLRKARTKREAKVIETLGKAGVNVPNIIEINDTNITMDLIKGKKLRDELNVKNFKEISKKIGIGIAKIHSAGIIHGDLTTSNMILKGREVFFIDFGLSFFSKKVEDKAVDLHLLRQALESRHHKIWKKAYAAVLEGYSSKLKDSKEVISRIETVEGRGRYKGKH